MTPRTPQPTLAHRGLAVALWAVGVVLGVVLGAGLIAQFARPDLGYDFLHYFVPAARAVAQGHSPYVVDGYVYSPLVALLMSPLATSPRLGPVWMICIVVGSAASALIGTLAVAPRGRSGRPWGTASIFVVAVGSLLGSYLLWFELALGQADWLVLLALCCVLAATSGRRAGLVGFGLGVAAVIKTWPAVIGVWLLRGPVRWRPREWAGVGLAAALDAVLTVGVAGPTGVLDSAKAVLAAGGQPIISYSAWGVGRSLFGGEPRVAPLAQQAAVGWAVTAVLVVGIVCLTLLSLRPAPAELTQVRLMNVVACVLLLLPIAHYVYLLLAIPLLWCWHAVVLRHPRRPAAWLALVSLGSWWWTVARVAPPGRAELAQTWPQYLSIVVPTFGMALVSVLALRRLAVSLGVQDQLRSGE